MPDIYVFDFSGGEEERARREAERVAKRAQVRSRYAQRVIEQAGVDEVTAELVKSALFDRVDVVTGELCQFGNHPKLPDADGNGDAGFDCRCQWGQERRTSERENLFKGMDEYWAAPEGRAVTARRDAERAELAAWIATQPGVEATQTTECLPEQWEGVVDGHSFYFRERHGAWRLELDIQPDGHFVNRYVGTGEDGEMITEPVETTSGTVIAEGLDGQLGVTNVDHLAFIVQAIRDHLGRDGCVHPGAQKFCPRCGARIDAPG